MGFLDRARRALKFWAAERLGGDWLAVAIDEAKGDPEALYRLLSRLGCEKKLLRAFANEGLYEAIALAAARGCEVSREVASEALVGLVLLGRLDRASVLEENVGLELPERGAPLYAYCSPGGLVEVRIGGRLYSSRDLSRGGRARIAAAALGSGLLELFQWNGAPVAVLWGCPAWYPGSVDAKLLISIVFPEAMGPPWRVAWHLALDARSPSEIVEQAARIAAWILEELDVDYDMLPEGIKWASRIPLSRYTWEPDGVVLTDRPRFSWRVVKAYRLDPPPLSASRSDDPWYYAALVAANSMALRAADPAAALGNPDLPERLAGSLREVLLSSIREAERRPPRSGQVPAWHVSCLPWKLKVDQVDCIRHPVDCASQQLEPPYEEPSGAPCPGGGGIQLPQSTTSMLVGATVRVASGSIRVSSPGEAASFALGLLTGSGLIVAPGSAVSVAAESLGARRLTNVVDAEEWLADTGGPAVAELGFILREPWILAYSGDSVVVLPEVVVRGPQAAALLSREPWPRALEKLMERVAWLAASLGGKAVSRALQEGKPPVKVEIVPVNEENEVGAPEPGVIAAAILEDWMREFRSLVKFSYPRPGQESAAAALAGFMGRGYPGLVMAVLPTGYGKSAIFMAAARAAAAAGAGSAALVVTPLRALMRDQVRRALEKGVPSVKIEASMPDDWKAAAARMASLGLVDLLYVAPERFRDPRIDPAGPWALIVLDEAHSLSRWGRSFRPSYLYMAKKLSEVRAEKGWPPILALTATAPPDVEEEIVASLGEGEPVYLEPGNSGEAIRAGLESNGAVVVRLDPIRPELRFTVRPAPRGEERLEVLAREVIKLKKWADSLGEPWVGVIFTGYVKSKAEPWANAEYVAKRLSDLIGEQVVFYHGQMPEGRRRRVESEILRASKEGGHIRIVVATKAFGMGVDIPRIRWIVHLTPSDSIEDYLQEAGRAGRDGKEAWAVSLYNPEDFKTKEKLLLSDHTRPSIVLDVFNVAARVAASLGGRHAVLPVEALPGGDLGLRALDILRASGALEYEVHRGPVVYKPKTGGRPEEELPWSVPLPGGMILGPKGLPRSEGLSVLQPKLEYCRSNGEVHVRMRVGGATIFSTTQRCQGWRGAGDVVVLVEWSPWIEPEPGEYLPPWVMLPVLRSASLEWLKLEELRRLMEEGLAAAGRGGDQEADRVMKSYVRRYFSKPLLEPVGNDPLPEAGVVECESPGECARKAAGLAVALDRLVGPRGYTVAYHQDDLLAAFTEAYREATGGATPRVAVVKTSRIVEALRERGWRGIMDRGYLVIIARKGRHSTTLAERLSGYPYHRIYITKI